MVNKLDIPADLSERIEALASRYRLDGALILRSAIEDGRSLEWQEAYFREVTAGLAEAEKGDFVDSEDVAALLARFRAR